MRYIIRIWIQSNNNKFLINENIFLFIYLILSLFSYSGLTNLQKVGLGLFFSILGMGTAALVEKRRLSVVDAHGDTKKRSTTLPISAFFLLPQFILVGIGEALMLSRELDYISSQTMHLMG